MSAKKEPNVMMPPAEPVAPVAPAERVAPVAPAEPVACPFHCHHVNEEVAFILSGHGTVRVGTAEYPIRAGDVIASPAGGADVAHQIVNTSTEDLRYLSVSTMIPMDIVEYPASDKILVRVGTAPGNPERSRRMFDHLGRRGPVTEYWEDE